MITSTTTEQAIGKKV